MQNSLLKPRFIHHPFHSFFPFVDLIEISEDGEWAEENRLSLLSSITFVFFFCIIPSKATNNSSPIPGRRLCFIAEWYQEEAAIIRTFTIYYFVQENAIEVVGRI